jgi:hypothetical protein
MLGASSAFWPTRPFDFLHSDERYRAVVRRVEIPPAIDAPVLRLLFRHHFAGQFTRHYLAELVAFLSGLDHGLSRAVMLGDAGGRFGV